MVAGQVIDLLGEGRTMTVEELEYLHRRKTGALFVAAVCGGARLGGAREAELEALETYARALGLAFQVIDDLLDVEASTAQMGKRTGKDAAHGKTTYPARIGLDQVAGSSRAISSAVRVTPSTVSTIAPNRCGRSRASPWSAGCEAGRG